MLKTLAALTLYVSFVWVFLVTICTAPAHAFQATNYARVVAQAELIALNHAKAASTAATVAAAAVAATPPSTLIKFVTSSNWIGLAVLAGITLASIYYTTPQLQVLRQRATPAAGADGMNPTHHYTTFGIGTNGNCSATQTGTGAGTKTCVAGYDQVAVWGTSSGCFTGFSATPSWEVYGTTGPGGNDIACWVAHKTGQPNGLVAAQGQPATQQQVQTFVQGLPDSDPDSLPSHTAPGGANHPAPTPADNSGSLAVDPAEAPSTVKQKPLPSQDAMIADNVPPPQGTQQQQQPQQASTTATTTNPDGSKTDTTTATVACTTPDHEARTFASVLQAHQQTWTTSGLLGAVTLLKSLVWPTTLPTISLPSQFFGTQTVNFNDWAWFFTALRTMVIAIATLASYRIIFVGGR